MDKYFTILLIIQLLLSKWSDDGNSNNRPFHLQLHQESIQMYINGNTAVSMNIGDIILNEWNMLTCVYDAVEGFIKNIITEYIK